MVPPRPPGSLQSPPIACNAAAKNAYRNERGFAMALTRIRTAIAMTRSTALAALLALTGSATGAADPAPAPAISIYLSLPIDVDVRPAEVQPVRGDDGRTYIAYTILVTNWADEPLTFSRIELVDENDRIVADYQGEALENPSRLRSTQWAEGAPSPANRRLDAGRTAVVQVGAVFAAPAETPRQIRHRLTFEPSPRVRLVSDDGTRTATLTVSSEPLMISARPVPVLGAPLRGGPWRCSNGLAFDNAHAAFYASRTARMRVPQRFGCDLQKVDAEGNVLPNPFPNVISNSMFYGYGAEVLAVGDGRIVWVRDGLAENVPQVDGRIITPVPLTADRVSGNSLALDLGGGRYAFYAHFQTGSIRVRAGQRVRRGDTLGLLGNSGNSVGPHLHFHLGNSPVLNGTDGMPYLFDCFDYLGRGRPPAGDAPGRTAMRRRLPLQGAVMQFPVGPRCR
jgi:hypothetical protein